MAGRWYSQFLGRLTSDHEPTALGHPDGDRPARLAPLCVTRWRISALMMWFKT